MCSPCTRRTPPFLTTHLLLSGKDSTYDRGWLIVQHGEDPSNAISFLQWVSLLPSLAESPECCPGICKRAWPLWRERKSSITCFTLANMHETLEVRKKIAHWIRNHRIQPGVVKAPPTHLDLKTDSNRSPHRILHQPFVQQLAISQ